MTAFEKIKWRLRVVHAHSLARAERRPHDPQRPLPHDRLLYVLQRPLGRIASMPATGQVQPVSVAAQFAWKRPVTLGLFRREARANRP